MVTEIKKDIQERCLQDFTKRLNKKRIEKGAFSFNSPLEGYAKIAEEFHELMLDMHKKNWDGFSSELLDIMISAYWSYCSIKAQE